MATWSSLIPSEAYWNCRSSKRALVLSLNALVTSRTASLTSLRASACSFAISLADLPSGFGVILVLASPNTPPVLPASNASVCVRNSPGVPSGFRASLPPPLPPLVTFLSIIPMNSANCLILANNLLTKGIT